jgi:multidrug efflux pump subunit AcrB
MNVSAPFIVRPIATTLLMIGLTLLGLVAYFVLPIAGVPQVDIPTLRVSANLPGANAETMATSVATPLEGQLSLIAGVTSISSTSSLGVAQIQVEFDLSRSIESAAQDVQSAINAAGGLLPKNLPNPPTYEKVNPADALLMSIAVTSADLPLVWSTFTASRSLRSAFRSTRQSPRPSASVSKTFARRSARRR